MNSRQKKRGTTNYNNIDILREISLIDPSLVIGQSSGYDITYGDVKKSSPMLDNATDLCKEIFDGIKEELRIKGIREEILTQRGFETIIQDVLLNKMVPNTSRYLLYIPEEKEWR